MKQPRIAPRPERRAELRRAEDERREREALLRLTFARW